MHDLRSPPTPYKCQITRSTIQADKKLLHFMIGPLPQPSLLLPRLLRITAHDLDLLRRDIVLVVELEIDIFDEERPDFVAEAVGIQMTLFVTSCQP